MIEYLTLIIIDECGDEYAADSYTLGNETTDAEMDLWKTLKIEEIQEYYPEAQDYYFDYRQDNIDYKEGLLFW